MVMSVLIYRVSSIESTNPSFESDFNVLLFILVSNQQIGLDLSLIALLYFGTLHLDIFASLHRINITSF